MSDPSLDPIMPLPLDQALLKDIQDQARDFALSHGVVMRMPHRPERSEVICHAPYTLIPSPFPRVFFEKAKRLQVAVNLLLYKVSQNREFLTRTLSRTIEGDDFTGRLFKIYQQVHEEKVTKDIELCLLRTDYMLDTARGESGNLALSMVEMNTIAASFAALAGNVASLHRFLLGLCHKDFEPSCIPDNQAIEGLAEGIVKAFHLYGQPGASVVFIVTSKEPNIFDQRFLEYAITKCDHRVKVIRRTLGDIGQRGQLTKDRRLFIDGSEVGVLYYRSCYVPTHFHSEYEWNGKLMGEQSRAVVCPSISWHLVGTKKVQQELAKPGVLEQFVDDKEMADFIRSSFAGQYTLDLTPEGDEAALRGIENPKKYVMKPQREGGGNNIYDDEVRTMLEKLAGQQEREGYILMDRILPPIHQNYLQPCGGFDDLKLSKVMSELGIFGTFISHNGDVVLNESKGHLLRTKSTDENEGGVASGSSCIDSPFLT
ncbi:glutathione synthetase-like [Lytechinus variegatus]|uniref:glutathione synthetase-like n=1 Tax=Lytechinus variegatus TaxID=7654 RepID=UPI001BB13F6B|nr:glutathione synthetase-like [Lytechinus variegatus]XP_041454308.1 glutathione synthetase-like [Lytechinus variegatus]